MAEVTREIKRSYLIAGEVCRNFEQIFLSPEPLVLFMAFFRLTKCNRKYWELRKPVFKLFYAINLNSFSELQEEH